LPKFLHEDTQERPHFFEAQNTQVFNIGRTDPRCAPRGRQRHQNG